MFNLVQSKDFSLQKQKEKYKYNEKKCAEKTILAILIFNENTTKEQVETIFSYIKDDMILGSLNKEIYKIFKDTYKQNKQIYGTKQFYRMLMQICNLENSDIANYMFNLEEYWSPTSTISYWIEKIQGEYFASKYSEAKSKKEFEKVIELERKFSYTQNNVETLSADDDIQEYEKRKNTAIFLPYKEVSKYVGSLQGGDMVILAGCPGSGKTCFMLNVALAIAVKGKKVDIYSLEMSPRQLRQRLVCQQANINQNKFRSFTLTDEEKKKYQEFANGQFKKLNINIYNKQTVTMDEIKRRTMKSDSDLVIIDYLGLISGDTNVNSYERYSNISRDIKLLAMESNKPILCLHQLSREYDKRDDKKPRISDLRDSGKIEQDADMIWLVYRPSMFNINASENDFIFILAKNRHGETNKEIKLIFQGERQLITDMRGYINEVYTEREAKN